MSWNHVFENEENDRKEEYRYWAFTAAITVLAAVTTAGANAIADEFRARWRSQRETK